MGRLVAEAVQEAPDMIYVGGVGRGDDLRQRIAAANPTVLVDFTTPEAVVDNLAVGIQHRLPMVVGTSGLTASDWAPIHEKARAAGVGIVYGANFALGAILLVRFARDAARYFPQAEIIEMHHDKKYDAPSGTAVRTAEVIASVRQGPAAEDRTVETIPGCRGGRREGVPIHSVRLPGLVAHQEVVMGLAGETLTLRHDLVDRRSFMPGVLLALRKVRSLVGVHDVEDVLFPGEAASHPL